MEQHLYLYHSSRKPVRVIGGNLEAFDGSSLNFICLEKDNGLGFCFAYVETQGTGTALV
jgi:hypothetical protein